MLVLALPFVVVVPLLVEVVALRRLQSKQHLPVVLLNTGQVLDSGTPIQRAVMVQSSGTVRFLAKPLGLLLVSFFVLDVNTEHLAQQDPVFILNLSLTLYTRRVSVTFTYLGSVTLF